MGVRGSVLCALVLSGGAACAPPASRGTIHGPDPASKLYAIHRAGEQGQVEAIPALVEQLDSDDPAVRMLSIEALERLTGTRLGYNPYASAPRRQASVDAWARAVQEGRFATKAATRR